MKGRKLLPPLVAAAAVSIAGCGVSAAQEDTSGEATTAEGGSSEGGDRSRSPRLIARFRDELRQPARRALRGRLYRGAVVRGGEHGLRAAPDRRLEIGDETNSQDNVIARALEGDSIIGDETSLAHHALIRDSEIGDFAFVGFQAEVIDSTVEDGALISAGSYVEDVTIPEDALLAPARWSPTRRRPTGCRPSRRPRRTSSAPSSR
jgi:hypothetical protein